MKTITQKQFTAEFEKQLLYANFHIREDITDYFDSLAEITDKPDHKSAVDVMRDNHKIAAAENRGICQDTGYVQIYLRLGDNVKVDFDFTATVNNVVERVYRENFLRNSIAHPITRENTKTNTPVFIETDIVVGDDFMVDILLKGGGSENVSRAGLLLPTASQADIEEWVVDVVRSAGAKACPPYIIGVGIGGTFAKSVSVSKKLLLQRIGESFMDQLETAMSANILHAINKLPIGFQGLKFGKTALSVKIKAIPCHIATLPIAVSIGCNAVRQASFEL